MKRIILVVIAVLVVMVIAACSSEKLVKYSEKPQYKVAVNKDRTLEKINQFKEEVVTAASGNIQNKPLSNNKKTITVRLITDSDTFVDTANNRYRLIGVNGPEITKGKNEPFGQEGKQYLEKLIKGKKITIESDPKAGVTDKYGRYLVYAFINGKSVQSILLVEGLVKVAYLFDQYQYTDQFKNAEAIAKQKGRNIWSIQGYSDTKTNAFNMNVVKQGAYDKVTETIKGISKWGKKAKDYIVNY